MIPFVPLQRSPGAGLTPLVCVPDPYYNGVSGDSPHTILSLHGESVIDSSSDPKTLTNSNVAVSSASSAFGSSSLFFNGTNAVLSAPDSVDTRLGTADWTVEFWVRVSGYPITVAGAGLVSKRPSAGLAANTWSILLSTVGSGQIVVSEISAGSFTNRNVGSPIALNTWTLVTVCRSGSNIYAFLNGVLGLSYTTAHNFDATSYPVTIGYNVGAGYFYGYIDDLRITKGVARNTADFTPPPLTFCDSAAGGFIPVLLPPVPTPPAAPLVIILNTAVRDVVFNRGETVDFRLTSFSVAAPAVVTIAVIGNATWFASTGLSLDLTWTSGTPGTGSIDIVGTSTALNTFPIEVIIQFYIDGIAASVYVFTLRVL